MFHNIYQVYTCILETKKRTMNTLKQIKTSNKTVCRLENIKNNLNDLCWPLKSYRHAVISQLRCFKMFTETRSCDAYFKMASMIIYDIIF